MNDLTWTIFQTEDEMQAGKSTCLKITPSKMYTSKLAPIRDSDEEFDHDVKGSNQKRIENEADDDGDGLNEWLVNDTFYQKSFRRKPPDKDDCDSGGPPTFHSSGAKSIYFRRPQ